jgi:hypothetical protein
MHGKVYNDPGWDCTGRDLLVVFTYHDMPVVIPTCLLRVVQHTSFGMVPDDAQVLPSRADHWHLVIDPLAEALKAPARGDIGEELVPLADAAEAEQWYWGRRVVDVELP